LLEKIQYWSCLHIRETRKTRERVHTGDEIETFHKWEPMELKYSKF